MIKKYFLLVAFISVAVVSEAKLPDLTPAQDTKIIDELLKNHAKYHQLTPMLVKRTLLLYLEELDPNKTYFIEPDIDQWLNPSDEMLNQIVKEINQSDYNVFMDIHKVLLKAIERRKILEKRSIITTCPRTSKPKNLKIQSGSTTKLNFLTV